MAAVAPASVQSVEDLLRSRHRLIAVLAVLVAAAFGVSVAQLAFGNGIAVALVAGVAISLLVWTAPWTGVIALAIAATLIEQFSLVSEGTYSDGTDHIPLFQSLKAGAGLAGIYATPFEVFLALLLAIWLIKGFANRSLALPRSMLGLSLGTFAAVVTLGWFRGVTSGGSFSDSLLELRPWLYLGIAFVASSQLITKRTHLNVLLAVIASGIAIKSIQGVITLAAHFQSRPQAILAHEESFFFGLYLAMLAGLWLIPIKGRLRTFMTLLSPFVLAADIANQRRTAWAVAAAVLAMVFLLCYLGLPERRRVVVMMGIAGCVLAGIYWIGFSNDPGLLGQPARALLSQIAPSNRDQQSNQYRVIENVDLGIAIRQSMPLGMGFGHPIPQYVPNANITNIDSFITYLPHNGVLYLWLRLGLMGIFTFWLFVCTALMTTCNVFRKRPSQIRMLISLIVAAALIAYLVQGFYDMGLYWFRIAVVVGSLLGALEASKRLEQEPSRGDDARPPAEAPVRGVRRAVDIRNAA